MDVVPGGPGAPTVGMPIQAPVTRWRPARPWHGPNGADYPNHSVFEALVPGERVVIRHISGPRFTLAVTLVAEGTGTRLTWRQSFDSASEFEAVRRFAEPANEENLDRLEVELARSPVRE